MHLQEDGDQSSRSFGQKNDQIVRNTMSRVGEEFPYHLAREPNQPLVSALCNFNLVKLQSIFEPEWLSYRATPNHLPITSLVVALAQRTTAPKAEAVPKFVTILEWLIDEGARVDARDIGGYTALGHAAAHTPVLPLAEVLLRKGANVNYQNRFGATVLMSAVMAAEVGSSVLFCLQKCKQLTDLQATSQHLRNARSIPIIVEVLIAASVYLGNFRIASGCQWSPPAKYVCSVMLAAFLWTNEMLCCVSKKQRLAHSGHSLCGVANKQLQKVWQAECILACRKKLCSFCCNVVLIVSSETMMVWHPLTLLGTSQKYWLPCIIIRYLPQASLCVLPTSSLLAAVTSHVSMLK